MIESKQVYRSLSRSITWKGVLTAESSVKPTISLKYIVTQSKLSASTGSPRLRASATDLKIHILNHNRGKRLLLTLATFCGEARRFSFSPPLTDLSVLVLSLLNYKRTSP